MSRYTFPAFNKSTRPRYVVLWDLHWHVLECQRLEPATDLSGAMATAISGWHAMAGGPRATPSMASYSFDARASGACSC